MADQKTISYAKHQQLLQEEYQTACNAVRSNARDIVIEKLRKANRADTTADTENFKKQAAAALSWYDKLMGHI